MVQLSAGRPRDLRLLPRPGLACPAVEAYAQFSGDSSLSCEAMMAGGDPRMWGMLLLGLLVGMIPLLADAALVRYLSQSRGNGHQGASHRAQASPVEGGW